MVITGFEIDFLPVGEKSASGDAILFRYQEDGKFKTILIDGGHKESGGIKTSETILRHMRDHYTDMDIEHIVCSHPDSDHIGGLQEVMEQCKVGTLWVNSPLNYITYGELENDSDSDKFCKGDADKVSNLIEAAEKKGISVAKPLQGTHIGPLTVCSPSREFYKKLVRGELERQSGSQARSLVARAIEWISTIWGKDDLYTYPVTSVCNESSTVLFGDPMGNGNKILLTADAGIEALSRSYKYLESNGISGSMSFMQMPHHGSRHNVNTEVLDALLGKKTSEYNPEERGCSYASVASETEDPSRNDKGYPRQAVINAFTTRGYLCYKTAGNSIRYFRGNMPRRNWTALTPIPYSKEVEALD